MECVSYRAPSLNLYVWGRGPMGHSDRLTGSTRPIVTLNVSAVPITNPAGGPISIGYSRTGLVESDKCLSTV